jgi:hypothetical protein
MKHPHLLALVGLCNLATCALSAQVIPERQADFVSKNEGASTLFAPVLPALVQRAGAPTAFYEYYWEFGDGTFSFAENARHEYQDTSAHEVFLMATGKYDNGKAPKSRKKPAEPAKPEPPKTEPQPKENPKSQVADVSPAVLPDPLAPLGMRAVRNPRAGEESVCILAYANRTPTLQSGKLYLFFNQRDYKHEHFQYIESRTHFGEQEEREALTWAGPPLLFDGWASTETPLHWYALNLEQAEPETILGELRKSYKAGVSWRFESMQPDELRNLFVSLQATDQMLADTNAIITVSALMVSDDRRIVEQFDLELEIVASHDPNYIAVSKRRTGFRHIQAKDLTYKVHFQNTGEGPASTVEITCDVPPGLDASKLRILDAYPLSLLCPDGPTDLSCLDTAFAEGRVIFTFRNIYLPGTRQEGVNDRDSTKGFVKYQLAPAKKIQKLDMASRASIVFDKNPPIHTNKAGTSFKPGLSPGLAAGWNVFPGNADRNHVSFGATLAPFSPHRLYLQWEVWTGFPTQPLSTESSFRDTVRWMQDIQGLGFVATIDSITTFTKIQSQRPLYFSVVPLQVRKNLSDWFGIGAGLLLNVVIQRNENRDQVKTERFVYNPDGFALPDFYRESTSETAVGDQETELRPALFADVHFGRVRQGPSLGLRGVLNMEKAPEWYVSAFAAWKF